MKLTDYLKNQKLSMVQFAIRNGMNPAELSKIMNKSKRISLQKADQIVKATKGKVTFNDLLEAELERK